MCAYGEVHWRSALRGIFVRKGVMEYKTDTILQDTSNLPIGFHGQLPSLQARVEYRHRHCVPSGMWVC